MKTVPGTITKIDANGIQCHIRRHDLLDIRLPQSRQVEICVPDDRHISPAQRRKIYALIGDIAYWQGDMPEVTKSYMKFFFAAEHGGNYFSLSICDMTTAREFITYLIGFMLRYDVPSRVPLYDVAEDMKRYVYDCFINKRCCVCGKRAQLHHVERVGMGRNRCAIEHLNMLAMPLCQTHHHECHSIPQDEFNHLYHIEPIMIDDNICKLYKLHTEE